MGLHIYSGSAVRFFTNDWENEIERWARETGNKYTAHHPDGEPKWPTRKEAGQWVANARRALADSLEMRRQDLTWAEDEADYHTIKLHDEAREAITIVSSYLYRPELVIPRQMPMIASDDPAYAEASAKGYMLAAHAPFESTFIIPVKFLGFTLIDDPLGRDRLVSSTHHLRWALGELAEKFWNGSTDARAWRERGLSYARGQGKEGANGREFDPEPPDSLRENAEFAFSVFSEMLDFADQHRTPILTNW